MQVNQQALDGAIKALKLRDVYFRDERVSLKQDVTPPFFPDAGEAQFKMTTRILHDFEVNSIDATSGGAEATERLIEMEFVGQVRCTTSRGEQSDEVLGMEVKLGLLYAVDGECSDECLDEFVRVNVAYHAIPYWREHVHSVCAKRRFYPITVPLYSQLTWADPQRVVGEDTAE